MRAGFSYVRCWWAAYCRPDSKALNALFAISAADGAPLGTSVFFGCGNFDIVWTMSRAVLGSKPPRHVRCDLCKAAVHANGS